MDECNTCKKDIAFLNIREAVEAGKYHCIYEQPGGEDVADAEHIRLEDRAAMLELLDDEFSLDYREKTGDDTVCFISKDRDGAISYAVAFEYDFKTDDLTIRITGDMPDVDESRQILSDFR